MFAFIGLIVVMLAAVWSVALFNSNFIEGDVFSHEYAIPILITYIILGAVIVVASIAVGQMLDDRR